MSKIKGRKKALYETYKTVWVGLETTYATGGEDIDPNDRWSNRVPEYLNMECSDNFTLTCDTNYSESVSVVDWMDGIEVIYGIVITYSTGDTFGYSSGHKSVPVAFVDSNKANELAKIVSEEKKWDTDKYGYMCWNGYFERLESVEVKKFDLLKTPLFKKRF